MWKKGRGKLGIFDPLLGAWEAEADSAMGPVRCERVFERVLGGAYVRLHARWHFGTNVYEEFALFGQDADRTLNFWSFTSDGKQSRGVAAAAPDLHPQALAFEAQMPAGLARMAYWPEDTENAGFVFAVESRNRKGWKRFVEHHYRRSR